MLDPSLSTVVTPLIDSATDAAFPVFVKPPSIDLRVLHVVNGEHFSGAERVQSHLGRRLPRFGVAADFAFVKPDKFAERVRVEAGAIGRGFDAAMANRLDLRVVRRIADLVDQHHFDLLHAHTPRTAMVTGLVAKRLGMPWVYHVHSPSARDSSRWLINRINASLEHHSLADCAHVITVSRSLRQETVDRGVTADRVSVVHNGVPAIQTTRKVVPVPGSAWTMGMVALHRPRKGLEVALRAIAKLRDHGMDVRLRIIGPFESDRYRQFIEDQCATPSLSNAIECIGFTQDVSGELGRMDALLLPSLYGEGLPMVVLEAMAAGLPVIATRVEGTPEAITHGVEGLLAEPNDADLFADQIGDLVLGRHDWTAMADAARRRHAACFSDVAMAAATAEVYRKVLRRCRQSIS